MLSWRAGRGASLPRRRHQAGRGSVAGKRHPEDGGLSNLSKDGVCVTACVDITCADRVGSFAESSTARGYRPAVGGPLRSDAINAAGQRTTRSGGTLGLDESRHQRQAAGVPFCVLRAGESPITCASDFSARPNGGVLLTGGSVRRTGAVRCYTFRHLSADAGGCWRGAAIEQRFLSCRPSMQSPRF